MEYVVVAFRSRAHTVKFHSFLSKNGVPCEIINTPKEAGVGCGLSVRIAPIYTNVAKRGVKITALPSFAGVFSVKTVAGRRLVRSV